MAIEIREDFQVQAGIDEVWRFLLDPERVVLCMPGAELQERVDDHNFNGTVRVKVGPIVVSYAGRAQFAEIDDPNHMVRVVGQGREQGGTGTAKGTMTSTLVVIDDGTTSVNVVARVDVTGRVMQLGARMMESVSQQLLQQFIACARQELEAETSPTAAPRKAAAEPIPILSLILKMIWSWLTGLFRRLFGKRKR